MYEYIVSGAISQVVTGGPHLVVMDNGLSTDDLPIEHGDFA